ncbi:MAG TPA: hypothetical protein DHN33_10850, partial [Eubacteriaceae bacterium]|nr:hypothetical protein [Eubacteriaceae bacterium]
MKISNKMNSGMRLFIAIAGFVIIFAVMVVTILPPNYNYEVGDVVEENIRAPYRITDEELTEQRRNEVVANVEEIYTSVENAEEDSIESILWVLDTIQDAEEIQPGDIEEIQSEFGALSDNAIYILRSMNEETQEEMRSILTEAMETLHEEEIRSQNIDEMRNEIPSFFEGTGLAQDYVDAGIEIASIALRPNVILDVESTNQAIEEAKDRIPLVTYEAGEVIVEEGEILSEEQLNLLKDNNMVRETYLSDPYLIVGVLLFLLIIFSVLAYYIRTFYEELIIKTPKRSTILIIIYTVMVFVAIGLSQWSMFLLPISMMTMTVALLSDRRLGITTTVFYVLIIALGIKLEPIEIAVFLINGYIASIGMIKVNKRADIMRTSLIIAVVNVLLIGSYHLITHNFSLGGIQDMVFGFSNGVISGILTLGTLVIWEYAFDITTPIMLAELANPNNPLLKKLMTNAPGTYHHSIMVGNLAESAAEKIGANALLVRVGAYYHDIGKSLSPAYFTENQMGDLNPHDYLTPQKSIQVIKNHVTKGFEMAKEYKIPLEVRNFILTHHGDSTIEFFYHKAKENEENPDREKYRYDAGGRPRTKEEGILALADSVEAAVRSIKEINEQ